MLAIAIGVSGQLWDPVMPPRAGDPALPTSRMLMPKAPMNQNHFPMTRKNDIRFPRKSLHMKAKPVSHSMDHRTNPHLRCGVRTPNGSHVFTSAARRQGVHRRLDGEIERKVRYVFQSLALNHDFKRFQSVLKLQLLDGRNQLRKRKMIDTVDVTRSQRNCR